MTLSHIEVRSIRIIAHTSLSLSPGINIFQGSNGSGKTSLLEAVHLLGLGRSFRTNRLNPVITHDQKECTVHGAVESAAHGEVAVGISRSRTGERVIHVNGEAVHQSSLLAELLPLQVMTPQSIDLLSGPPGTRRAFMNWGVFHVEHSFKNTWREAQNCLKQRNTLLRDAKIDDRLLEVWSAEFAERSLEIDGFRRVYFDRFVPYFNELLSSLINIQEVTVEYYPGWDRKVPLLDILRKSTAHDIERGYTGVGHHRADLKVRVHGRPAIEVLSRGEQKLTAAAMMITQGYILSKLSGGTCTYLVDDLASELDVVYRKRLFSALQAIDSQVLITSVEKETLLNCNKLHTVRLFHVKHGEIKPLE